MPKVKRPGPDAYRVKIILNNTEVSLRILKKSSVAKFVKDYPEREVKVYYRGFLAGYKLKGNKSLKWL